MLMNQSNLGATDRIYSSNSTTSPICLALAAGPTVIRFLPPLVIDQEDLDRVVELTAEVLQ